MSGLVSTRMTEVMRELKSIKTKFKKQTKRKTKAVEPAVGPGPHTHRLLPHRDTPHPVYGPTPSPMGTRETFTVRRALFPPGSVVSDENSLYPWRVDNIIQPARAFKRRRTRRMTEFTNPTPSTPMPDTPLALTTPNYGVWTYPYGAV